MASNYEIIIEALATAFSSPLNPSMDPMNSLLGSYGDQLMCHQFPSLLFTVPVLLRYPFHSCGVWLHSGQGSFLTLLYWSLLLSGVQDIVLGRPGAFLHLKGGLGTISY